MTLAEKHQLVRLIQNLHPQNMDRIVEIIQRGKPAEVQFRDDITIDLQNEVIRYTLYFNQIIYYDSSL